MIKTILITGASSGIGQAVAKNAARLQLNVIATARREKNLQELAVQYPNIQLIVADVSTDFGRDTIIQAIKKPIDYLLHNAAILDAPQKLIDLTVKDFRQNIYTNVEPIIFLTQKLIPFLKASNDQSRILSISSGAAKQAIAGLGNYCTSKAAALMANQILKVEMPRHGVIVNDFFPGTVNTTMQKTLRSSNSDVFPYSDEFKKLKTNNHLNDPEKVASYILDIFLKSTDEEFSEEEWTFKTHDVLG
jgi:NAD(P)-dependent dehydrogenase (short-subunit alcohol dehydrogenase family)